MLVYKDGNGRSGVKMRKRAEPINDRAPQQSGSPAYFGSVPGTDFTGALRLCPLRAHPCRSRCSCCAPNRTFVREAGPTSQDPLSSEVLMRQRILTRSGDSRRAQDEDVRDRADLSLEHEPCRSDRINGDTAAHRQAAQTLAMAGGGWDSRGGTPARAGTIHPAPG
jgi:hypothetical protein